MKAVRQMSSRISRSPAITTCGRLFGCNVSSERAWGTPTAGSAARVVRLGLDRDPHYGGGEFRLKHRRALSFFQPKLSVQERRFSVELRSAELPRGWTSGPVSRTGSERRLCEPS